jgi:hypothetical protein
MTMFDSVNGKVMARKSDAGDRRAFIRKQELVSSSAALICLELAVREFCSRSALAKNGGNLTIRRLGAVISEAVGRAMHVSY